MLNPNYLKFKSLYELNDLAFKTKYEIINSNSVQEILPPFQSFLDKRNTHGKDNYLRYCLQANYISFPNLCLDAVLGIVNKEDAVVKLPANMENLIYYATDKGTPLVQIQNEIIEMIFKFGLAGIIVDIPENVSVANSLPKLKVYGGNKIVDYQYFTDGFGMKKIKFITFDESRYVYSENSKSYSFTKIYKVHSLTADERYCITEMLASNYSTFDPSNPSIEDGILSMTFPSWTSELNFIPFVAVSRFDLNLNYGPSFIQDLIDISLQNFRLNANLCWLEANAASSHLVIKGQNLDNVSEYPVGAGAVHVLNDANANEFYVTPSIQGIAEIKSHIAENTALAQDLMYNLTNVAANSSGESLKIRISSKMQDLIGLLKNIGYGLTLALENIDKIMNNGINRNSIEYLPYLGFAKISSYIGEEEKIEKIENGISE